MNIGFLTNCLNLDLEKKINTAKNLGFDDLEIICGYSSDSDIQLNKLSNEYIENIKKKITESNLQVSSLAFYKNILTEDKKKQKSNIEALYKLVDLAKYLDTKIVSTFIGKNPELNIEDNFDIFQAIFTPFVKYAELNNIKIAIENCSMPSWSSYGYPSTISYSPEFWDEMFKRIPSKSFGLNYDPSHLIWQQIDYIHVLNKYSSRIFNVHLNDIKLEKKNLDRYGIFGKQLEREHIYDFGWYKPIILGSGDIDWKKTISILKEQQYKGSLTIEFKDKNYRTNPEIIHGLQTSKEYINKIIKGENKND